MSTNLSYDENELLLNVAKGDEKAFKNLYDLYSPRVFSLALHFLKSHDAAQDIVQENFIKLWNKKQDLPGLDNFEGWLGRIVKNLLIDELRKHNRNLPEDPSVSPADPEKEIISKQAGLVIRQAIEKLPPRQKEIYQLARDNELSHNEIASQLGLSPETVKAHMKQALRNLREWLKKMRND